MAAIATRRIKAASFALMSATALIASGCRPEGKVETIKDLPERQKAVDASMQKNYGAGGVAAPMGNSGYRYRPGGMGAPAPGMMSGSGGAPAPAMMPPPPGPPGR